MHAPKRIAAVLAASAAAAGFVPAVSIADTPALPSLPGAGSTPTLPSLPGVGSDPNLCISGVPDYGPFGPYGPYGASGPYGPNGPMNGQTNPIGDAAGCGGLMTFILRGGTFKSFIEASTGGH